MIFGFQNGAGFGRNETDWFWDGVRMPYVASDLLWEKGITAWIDVIGG